MRPKGTLGLAFAAFKLWRRLPPAQRALVASQLRRHGPKAAAALAGYLRTGRRPRRRPPRGRS